MCCVSFNYIRSFNKIFFAVRFSHGETVLLSQLKEYEEPDFE